MNPKALQRPATAGIQTTLPLHIHNDTAAQETIAPSPTLQEEIRLLSLWEPWASFIPAGIKQIETRSWYTPYRGKIAIHAAKQPTSIAQLRSLGLMPQVGQKPTPDQERIREAIDPFLRKGFPYGAIVATATVTNCLRMTHYCPPMPTTINIDYDVTPLERLVGEWSSGKFAWMLTDIRPIATPIPYRGRQGLSAIQEPDVLAAIQEQLAA